MTEYAISERSQKISHLMNIIETANKIIHQTVSEEEYSIKEAFEKREEALNSLRGIFAEYGLQLEVKRRKG